MARIAIVALVIAGFFLTGDISAVVRGGQQLLTGLATIGRQLPTWKRSHAAQEAATPPPLVAAPPPAAPEPAEPRIPAAATHLVRLRELRPGDRVLVWCRADGGAGGELELLAFDLIDPSRGEALLSRRLDAAADLAQLASATGRPPERVVLGTDAIQRATMLTVQPVAAGPTVLSTGLGRQSRRSHQVGPVIAAVVITR